MPTPETSWYYVAGFAVFGWALLAVFAGLRVGKVQGWWVYGVAVLGTACTFLAGAYMLATPPAGWIDWLAGWSYIRFGMFLYVMISVVLLIAGMIPDQWLAASLGMNTAIFALLLPSLLAAGVVPGEVGNNIESTSRQVQTSLLRETGGWFG